MMNSSPELPCSEAVLLAKLEAEQIKRANRNRLHTYVPYPKQAEFHAAGSQFRERLFLAGNRCLTPWSYIQTDRGERQIFELFGEAGFGAQSWDGSSRCNKRASNVFLRGIEPAFQIHLDNGEVFQCSGRHRVFSTAAKASRLPSGWVSIDRLIRELDAVHYTRTSQDWKASYVSDAHPDDAQPLWLSDIDREPSPIRFDVPSSDRYYLPVDAAASKSGRNRLYPTFCRHSIRDEMDQLAGLCEHFESPAALLLDLPKLPTVQSQRQSAHELILERLAWQAEVLRALQAAPHVSNVLLASKSIPVFDGNSILAVIEIGYQPIVDIEVFDTHNYIGGGVIHHNCGKTQAGASETAMHLTGQYPPWWEGKRFNRPVRVWAAGVTGESTRDVVQEKLFGPPDRRDAWGTGALPFDSIGDISMGRGIANAIDMASIKHISGGWSSLMFKSYEKGREKWQGAALEVIWMDEEPSSMELYMEGLTRTNETGGIVFLTCTPLFGMSQVIRRFLMPDSIQ